MKSKMLLKMNKRGMFLLTVFIIIHLSFGVSCSKKKWQPVIQNDESLIKLLTEVSKQYYQPAMAAALVHGDSIIAQATVGKTVYGEEQVAHEKSRFHIGSTTKSMTAIIVAMLVKQGKLKYAMTLAQALPDMPMRDEYRRVTIADLLNNKAGILAFQLIAHEDPMIVKKLMEEIPTAYPDPTEQRREVTKLALSLEPIAEPGTKVIYSNVGWPIVGYILEQVTGKSYEDLLQEWIFEPLGMKTARIGGWPASESEPDQPRGHYFGRDTTSVPTPQDLEHQNLYGYGLFSVILKSEEILIGDCGLEHMEVDGEKVAELGYDLRSDYWNQGFATEAASAVRDYAFNELKLPCLISLIQVFNGASRRVSEKIGMRCEAEIIRNGVSYWKYSINGVIGSDLEM
ncbi:D-aminopeptidase [subsurface metagenome]